MNPKIKKIFTNARVIVLLVFLVFAVIAIHPADAKGVTIRHVAKNSSASLAGIISPKPTAAPMSRERVIAIDNIPINSVQEYYDYADTLSYDQPITIHTNKNTYRLKTQPITETIIYKNETVIEEYEEIIRENKTINGTEIEINTSVNKTRKVPRTEVLILGTEDIGLNIYDAPSTNIRKGLDLQGGTRVLLAPEEKVNRDEMNILLANMKQRLNVYGLSDVIVKSAGDLSGNQFIVIEIAGINEQEVKELLAKQGKFEAKIGNKTVFRGGSDITYVCRSADCSGIDPMQGCSQTSKGYGCRFRFSIALSPEAARIQANLTGRLGLITMGDDGSELSKNEWYLNETLDLYLDDENVDSLNIGSDLKGRAVTDIAISGWGSGTVQQEAVFNSLENMKRLQTILITGSLPIKLNIVKTDTISPTLGEEFVNNALLVGILAILSVVIVVAVRYRKALIAIPMLVTSFSEVILLLGLAALIGWNIDLAAIAGIIIAVGTGVDHQIIITDETLRKDQQLYSNWKKKIKNALFIIMAAYFTTMVAMIPLIFAGAGLLKGFAITTMMGISFGVFITRPAYAAIAEILLKE